ncbi:MAG TPA: hypothetical protein VLE89_08065 [Chlamydiales bacterium]|nr:hypothetical protein [Chlamydiales bacterium]
MGIYLHINRANQNNYAPAIQIERKVKNIFLRFFDWIASCFCHLNTNRHVKQAMHALFQKRVEVYKEGEDPTAAKAISFVQQFLVGPKRKGLEPSHFEQSRIPFKRMMDPVFLEIALLKDPEAYVTEEKKRLETYRIQMLQMAAHEIQGKEPRLAARCAEIIGKADQLSANDISEWMAEISGHRSKAIPVLEGLVALMQIDEKTLEAELLTHYLASLQIQEKFMLQDLPKNALSQGEILALGVLNKRLAQLREGALGELEPLESKSLYRFLEGICGNSEFNKRLRSCPEGQYLAITKQAFDFAADFSFKFSRVGEYQRVIEKVKKLEAKLEAHEATTAEEKLSLQEMRKVESVARLHEKFAQMAQIGIPFHHPLVDLAGRADLFVQRVLRIAEQQTPHKGASCMFYDCKNADDYYGNWSGGPIRRFIYNHLIPWPLLHTALPLPHLGENWTSHMHNNRHILHRRRIGDYAFKTFEIEFSKIISARGKQALLQHYGENWEREVERMYTQIIHGVHTNREALAPIQNPAIRRVLAAISLGYGIFDNRAFEHRPLNKQQICSAFVLNTWLAAFTTLELRLKVHCNMAANFRFIEMPIHKKRLLDFITPHQLAKTVLPISREVEKPEIIRQVLNFHEYKMV